MSLHSYNFISLLLLIVTTTAYNQPSPGCKKALPLGTTTGKSTNVSIESGHLQRSYLLHLPATYDGKSPVPLILSFHGRTKNAKQQEDLSQFSNATYNPNAIAVYPQGVMNSRGTRQWQGDPDSPASINDVEFTMDIINQISSTYCISPDRIFVAGKSNGGGLVNLLACNAQASSLIAAFAPVSGAFYLQRDGLGPACTPARSPLPMLEFHGWRDETIPYDGGSNKRGNAQTAAIPAWVGDWASRAGCTPGQNSTVQLCGEKKPVLRYAWSCRGVSDVVVHYNISNIRHAWPSTYPNNDGDRTTCFDATRLIMEFFGKHQLPGPFSASMAYEAEQLLV